MEEIKLKPKSYDELSRALIEATTDNLFLEDENKHLKSIIKEVREYLISYESIETIQQFDHNENNKDLDNQSIVEMARRYLIVHDKLLEILDKENK